MADLDFDMCGSDHGSDSDSTSRDESDAGLENESQESVGLFDDEDAAQQGKETSQQGSEINISQLSDFSVMNDSQYSELYRSFEASQATAISDALDAARAVVNTPRTTAAPMTMSASAASTATAAASTDDGPFWLTPRSQPVRVRTVGTQTEKSRKYLCVHFKKGKYQAFSKIKGKDTYIGRFDTPEEAALQVDTFILANTDQLNRPRQLNFAHHAHKQYVYDTAKKKHLAYPTAWTLPNDF